MRLIALSLLFFSGLCFAESIELSTGEVIDGKVKNIPSDLVVELSDGTKKKISYSDIESIYKLKPPTTFTPFLEEKKKGLGKENPDTQKFEMDEAGSYASPVGTFLTWKAAALQGDIDKMSDCYVSHRKKEVRKKLRRIPRKKRDEMRKAMLETIFTPMKPFYQGEMAILEVTWTKGLVSQTQTLKFSLEGQDTWKILE